MSLLQWLPCLYPIPVSVEGYGLVYNKEIFKDAGIDASTLTSYDAIDKAFADLQNQIDSGKLKDKYPQLEAVEEYAAKETWIPGLHTLNAPLACEYSSATELRNSDQLGLKYADSLKALLDLETKYTTSKDDLSKLNAVDYSSEIGGGLAIERVAVVQQGNWIGPELSGIDEEVANKMGILPIPLKGVKEDCIPTGISIYWCINSQSGDKEKEASKEFLKWLFQSDEGKQIVVNDFGFVPAFNNYDDVEITDTLSKEVKRLPKAIAPDKIGQIWSGSAVVDEENQRMVAFFTYSEHETKRQSQGVAFSYDKGRTWEKYSGNPILTDSREDFRDPKVFRYEEKWVMILSGGDCVLLYESKDLIHWNQISSFKGNQESHTGV